MRHLEGPLGWIVPTEAASLTLLVMEGTGELMSFSLGKSRDPMVGEVGGEVSRLSLAVAQLKGVDALVLFGRRWRPRMGVSQAPTKWVQLPRLNEL